MSRDVAVWALGRDGAPDAFLPDLGDYAITPIAGDVGSVSIDYPLDGLRFGALRALIGEDRPVEVEVRTDGTSANALGALLYTAKGDDIRPGNVWTFTGYTLEVLMRRARLPYNTDPAQGGNEKGETSFSANAGVVMRTLMQQAQARGTLTDIDFSSFSNTHDSNGVPWERTAVINLSPGRDYADILATTLHANELCEWEVTRDRQLRLYNPGTRGVDRTLPGLDQLTLEHGRDLEDAPIRHDVTDVITHLTGAGKDGLYTEADNPTALARLGDRVEGYQSFGDVADPGTLAAVTQLAATALGEGVSEHTHGLILESEGHPIPGRDFALSDWVLVGVNGATARRRVVRYSLSRKGREVKAAVTLGDLISARAVRVQRQIDALTNGSTVVGTSAPPPDVDDGKAPAAPEGVTGNSTAYYDGAAPRAQVTAAWLAVVTNDDGTAIGDLDGYEVQYRYGAGQNLPTEWVLVGTTGATSLSWSGILPGRLVEIRVLARDRYGRDSAWSPTFSLVTASDAQAPPTPSVPVVTGRLGQLLVSSDGRGSEGEPMPEDLDRIEAHTSTVNNPTDTPDTLFDQLVGSGATVYTAGTYGITQYFWLIAVDRSGNRSAPSATAAGTPAEIGYADIAFSQVGNLVEDGSFELAGSRATHAARSDAAWSFVEGGADHGAWFARGDAAVGSGVRLLRLSGPIPIVPGQRLAYRLAIRGTGVNGNLSARVQFLLGDGTTTDLTLGFTPADATGAWIGKEVPNYTAPADTVSCRIVVVLESDCTTGTWDVDRVEVREMIGTLLVQDAAITNAKIANLDVGKLTSGELTAIVAMLGMIRTAAPPLKRVEIDGVGIRKYDADNILRAEITEDETYLDGRIVTGRPGESRISMGANAFGRDNLVAYDFTGSTAAVGQVYDANTGQPFGNGVLVQRSDNGQDLLQAFGSGGTVGVSVYNPDTGLAVFRSRAGQNDRLDARHLDSSRAVVGEVGSNTSGMFVSDSSGGTVFYASRDLLFFQTALHSGAKGRLSINNGQFFSIGLDDGGSNQWGFQYLGSGGYGSARVAQYLQVVDPTSSSFREIRASNVTFGSGVDSKDDFTVLPASALGVLRGAPVARWRYRGDLAEEPLHIGPVAEDLPEWAVQPPDPDDPVDIRLVEQSPTLDDDGNEVPTPPVVEQVPSDLPNTERISVMSMIGLLWDAVRELDEELDEVRREQGRTPPTRRRVSDLLADIRAGQFPRRRP